MQKSDLPPAAKAKAISSIEYGHTQALSGEDRRDSVSVRRRRWTDFIYYMRGTNVVQEFRKLNPSRWFAIEGFMGISDEEEIARLSFQNPKKENRWKNASAEKVLTYLAERAWSLAIARENPLRKYLSEPEIDSLLSGLSFLELDAKRIKMEREKDRRRIVRQWKVTQPLARRVGLLDEFDEVPETIERVKRHIKVTLF